MSGTKEVEAIAPVEESFDQIFVREVKSTFPHQKLAKLEGYVRDGLTVAKVLALSEASVRALGEVKGHHPRGSLGAFETEPNKFPRMTLKGFPLADDFQKTLMYLDLGLSVDAEYVIPVGEQLITVPRTYMIGTTACWGKSQRIEGVEGSKAKEALLDVGAKAMLKCKDGFAVVALASLLRAALKGDEVNLLAKDVTALKKGEYAAVYKIAGTQPNSAFGDALAAIGGSLATELDFAGALTQAEQFKGLDSFCSFLSQIDAMKLPLVSKGQLKVYGPGGTLVPPKKLSELGDEEFVVLRDSRATPSDLRSFKEDTLVFPTHKVFMKKTEKGGDKWVERSSEYAAARDLKKLAADVGTRTAGPSEVKKGPDKSKKRPRDEEKDKGGPSGLESLWAA